MDIGNVGLNLKFRERGADLAGHITVGEDGFIAAMAGVRGGEPGLSVQLWRKGGRLVVRAYNQAGYDFTEIDLGDLQEWLKANADVGAGPLPAYRYDKPASA